MTALYRLEGFFGDNNEQEPSRTKLAPNYDPI
jgi:hypothetical protein